MLRHTMPNMLPSLASEVRRLRLLSGLTYARVAAEVVRRDGSKGISESTLVRFEQGRHWPEDPDAVVAAYAAAIGVEPAFVWAGAVARHGTDESQPLEAINGELATG